MIFGGGYLEFPNDTVLYKMNVTSVYPNADQRQLMFFTFWNIVNYFNPNNYILDIPWDTTLYNNVTVMDVVSDGQSLSSLYTRIEALLDDDHVFDLSYSRYYQRVPGVLVPQLRLKYVDSEYVVTRSGEAGISPGDVIISIDGMTTKQWEDSLKPYFSVGNLSGFRNYMDYYLLGREMYGTTEGIVIQDSTGTNNRIAVKCLHTGSEVFFTSWYYPADSLDAIEWTTMGCDVGYANMANLLPADVPAMYSALQDKSAIILDLRNYPQGYTIADIAQLMYPNYICNTVLLLPDITYPGTYSASYGYSGVNGNPTQYYGQVIILINEVSVSYAEFSAMILGAIPGAIKVGSQTQGADGDVTFFSISNDLQFGFSSLGVFYPNGDSTQRIGIVPDSVVYPTRSGIRHSDDEVLDKALRIAGCGLATPDVQANKTAVSVFPNPANDVMNITAKGINANEVNIELTDITGRILLQKEVKTNGGNIATTFTVKGLSSGMYFVTLHAAEQQFTRKIIKE